MVLRYSGTYYWTGNTVGKLQRTLGNVRTVEASAILAAPIAINDNSPNRSWIEAFQVVRKSLLKVKSAPTIEKEYIPGSVQ